MRRRDTVLVLTAALVIALLAWFFFAREKSDAPTAPPPPGAMGDDPALSGGRIYFSAGGSVYAVRPDGDEFQAIIQGDRGDPRDHELRLVGADGRSDRWSLTLRGWRP